MPGEAISVLGLPVHPEFEASPFQGAGTGFGLPTLCLGSDTERSSSFHCRHNEFAVSAGRIVDRVAQSVRVQPCLSERP